MAEDQDFEINWGDVNPDDVAFEERAEDDDGWDTGKGFNTDPVAVLLENVHAEINKYAYDKEGKIRYQVKFDGVNYETQEPVTHIRASVEEGWLPQNSEDGGKTAPTLKNKSKNIFSEQSQYGAGSKLLKGQPAFREAVKDLGRTDNRKLRESFEDMVIFFGPIPYRVGETGEIKERLAPLMFLGMKGDDSIVVPSFEEVIDKLGLAEEHAKIRAEEGKITPRKDRSANGAAASSGNVGGAKSGASSGTASGSGAAKKEAPPEPVLPDGLLELFTEIAKDKAVKDYKEWARKCATHTKSRGKVEVTKWVSAGDDSDIEARYNSLKNS